MMHILCEYFGHIPVEILFRNGINLENDYFIAFLSMLICQNLSAIDHYCIENTDQYYYGPTG